MTDKATQIIANGMRAQGAHYPQAGALLILAGLQAARIAVVELPEPSEYREDRDAMWNCFPFVGAKGEDITVGATCEYVYTINATEARALAAALLAAAAAAETQHTAQER